MSSNQINSERKEEIIRRYNATMIVVLLLSILKIFEIVDWDWIWVFSPLWIPVATAAFILCLGITIGILLGTLRFLFKLIHRK